MRASSPDDPRFRRSRERLLTALRRVAREGDLTIPAVVDLNHNRLEFVHESWHAKKPG